MNYLNDDLFKILLKDNIEEIRIRISETTDITINDKSIQVCPGDWRYYYCNIRNVYVLERTR